MAFFAQVQPEPNIGGQIGQSIGQGLMSGMQGSLQQRMQMQQQAQQQAVLQQRLNQFLQTPEGRSMSPEEKSVLTGIAQGLYAEPLAGKLLEEGRKAREFQQYMNMFPSQEGIATPTAPGQISSSGQPPSPQLNFNQLNDSQLEMLTGHPYRPISEAAKTILSGRRSEKEQGRKEETALSQDFLKQIEADRSSLIQDQADLDIIKQYAPDVGATDYIAELTGFEPLRTAKGSAFKTAAKNYYIDSLRGAGQRPNMWIEQQIQTAMEQVGKKPVANLAIAETQQYKNDLRRKKQEISDRLSQQYRNAIGYVPAKISSEVQKELTDYNKEREKLMMYNLRKNEETYMNPKEKKYIATEKVRKGTPLTLETARIFHEKYGDQAEKIAKALGYEIMPDEFYLGLMQ